MTIKAITATRAEDVCNFTYIHSICFGAAVGFSQVLNGAVLFAIFMYCNNTDFADLHIIFCTFGFHFFSFQALLSKNVLSGFATQLKPKHRTFFHVCLQFCCLVFTGIGFFMAYKRFGIKETGHFVWGLLSTCMVLLSSATGVFALSCAWPHQLLHIFFGIPTFFFFALSICTGIARPVMKKWFGDPVYVILILFVVFYTSVVLLIAKIKWFLRLAREQEN